jgi:phospholipid/cholesterol/gamma-HCH transport system substrate-binding protein
MTEAPNHWKLGLFIVLGLILGLGASIYFGSRALGKRTITYHSYFDEAVTGLEVGSPAKFRGVTVGQVSRIEVARDFRHVLVSYDIAFEALHKLGLAAGGEGKRARVPPELRAQLGSMGVTGVKFVQIDFFDPKTATTVKVPFKIEGNYIPATPSTMKNLEDSVTRAADRLPALTDQLVVLVTRVDQLTGDVAAQHLPERAAAVLTQSERTLQLTENKLSELQLGALSTEARATFAHLNQSIGSADRILARIDGDKGILASAQRVSDSMGDAARDARGFGSELSETLREVSGAAEAIHEFVDEIQRDPDMLLKGRAEARR